MTVIAWDGHTLAADKQSGDEWTKYGVVTKIHRVPSGLVGCSGTSSLSREMVEWVRGGCKASELPQTQRDDSKCCTVLHITTDKKVHVYQSGPYPIEFEGRYYAIGSGKDAASAVMEMGASAQKAVEIASVVCSSCGNGIDVLSLE